MRQSSETSPPMIGNDRPVKMSQGALVGIIGMIVAGAVAWTALRAQVNQNTDALHQHEQQFHVIQAKLDSQGEVLNDIRSDLRVIRNK